MRQRLEQVLADKGWSEREWSRNAGLSESTLRMIRTKLDSGQGLRPSAEVTMKLAEAAGVDHRWLLGDDAALPSGAVALAEWLVGPPKRSQAELASELGVKQQTVSQWCKGVNPPGPLMRVRLQRLCGISTNSWGGRPLTDADTSDLTSTLQERISWILTNRDFQSERDLALKAGLSHATLANALRFEHAGRPVQLRSDTVIRLAAAADVNVSWLLTGSGAPETTTHSVEGGAMPAQKLLDPEECEAVSSAVRQMLAETDASGRRVWSQARLGSLFNVSQEAVRRAMDPNGVGPAVRDGVFSAIGASSHEELTRLLRMPKRASTHQPREEWQEAVAALVDDGWELRRAKEVVGSILLDEHEPTALRLYRLALRAAG